MGIQGIFNFLAFLLPVHSALQVHDLNFNSAECVSMLLKRAYRNVRALVSADAHLWRHNRNWTWTVLKDKTCVKPSWVFSVYYLFQDFRVWGFED